jgi:hypothetical protein
MTTRILSVLSVSALLLLISASPLPAQKGQVKGFSLDLSAGLVDVDAFDSHREAFSLTPRWKVASFERLDVVVPIRLLRITHAYHPDPNVRPHVPNLCSICPACCASPCIDCPPMMLGFDALEVGPTWVLTPSVELVYRPGARLRPGFFVGGGVWREGGRSTDVEGLGTFRTSHTTRPVATYGLNLTNNVSDRLSLRLEAGAFTAFGGTTKVTTPTGQKVSFEREDVTSGLVSLGLGFSFR